MSTLRVANLQSTAGTQTVTQDRLYRGAATAWVNFNGTGTVAIRSQFNVSSITDNGTGDYTVNFASALADANYVVVMSAQDVNNLSPGQLNSSWLQLQRISTSMQAGSVRVGMGTYQQTQDALICNVTIFGN